MFFHLKPLSARGACADLPEEQKRWFFSKRGNTYLKAVHICHTCPIEDECLRRAVDNETPGTRRYGVYGGMPANERREKFG